MTRREALKWLRLMAAVISIILTLLMIHHVTQAAQFRSPIAVVNELYYVFHWTGWTSIIWSMYWVIHFWKRNEKEERE